MANPTKQEMFEILFQQYLALTENRDRLIKEATTAEQGFQILQAWQQANLNQLTMGNAILDENTQQVAGIVSDLKDAQQQMTAALTELQATAATLEKVNSTISAISKAVSLGTKLVGMI
jgi:DNA repair exonuclease SbcCD ATPase subunit